MKLQKEYDNLKSKIAAIDKAKGIEYKNILKQNGGYKDFNTRFAWDLLHAVISTSEICSWYDKYNCNDSHINTLAIRVCKDLRYI